MARELPKLYEPQQVEPEIYKMWEEGGFFKPQEKESAKPFTIVMPPPMLPASCTWATQWTPPCRIP